MIRRNRALRSRVLFLVAVLALASATIAASAQAAAPAWRVIGVTGPTNLPPAVGATPGSGSVVVYVSNVGGLPSSGTVTLNIGPLPEGISAVGTLTGAGAGWSCGVAGLNVTCTRTASVRAGKSASTVTVPVSVGPLASPNSIIPISVEGGGAPPDPSEGNKYLEPVVVSSKPASPGIQALWAGAFDSDGQPATQAGGHPYSAAAGFVLNTILTPGGQVVPAGDLRDLNVELPPGFMGNPMATERCPQYQLTQAPGTACSANAAIGSTMVSKGDVRGGSDFNEATGDTSFTIYNDEPAFGYAAEFTFPYVTAQLVAVGSLRSDGDYGVTATAANVPLYFKPYGSFFTLNGNPAGAGTKAFLTNPTDCAEQALVAPVTTIAANSWHQPTIFDAQPVVSPPVVDCDELKFDPTFSFAPSSTSAATGIGATAKVHVNQEGLLGLKNGVLDPEALAPPHLKDSVVTLPEGLTLNPAAADGLEACTTAQMGLLTTKGAMPNPIRFNKAPVSCPDASKIGTAEIETPLLDEPLAGTVYLAAQEDNPFNSLLAMYIVIDDAKTGVVAKLPGKVTPNGDKGGQLTATFENNPQVPFEDLTLKFRGGGPRSTLATPDLCAPKYDTASSFTPWSAPESGPPATPQSSFAITTGVGGSAACPTTKAARPFDIGVQAGSTNPVAGAHSPFTLRITRPDGNQELDKIHVTTPPGFAATLKGVAICSEAQLAAAQAPGRTGKQEIASPSCPAQSQVGTTTIGAGVGSQPLYVKTGKVYLSGPYKGAPASLSFVVPAVAGPFDLGVQVVRTALKINPTTVQVTAESDQIPQILKGIPLLIRDVRVDLDRPGFTLNPTSCEPMSIATTVTGASGAVSSSPTRFQVDGCKNLGFKPGLKLRLHGKTRRAAYQRLEATVTYPKGAYANIARASVALPHSEFLAQEHINTICTRVQFAAHQCPAGSIYGHAEAESPLLDGKLTGPVYLRSSDNPLPDLVVALRGPDAQPIEVELAGRTDSVNGGIRNTFDVVPDAPVSKFSLKLFGGKKSLIVNSRNLCKGPKQKATVKFTAHNGKVRNFRPVVGNDCGKKKGGKGEKHSRSRRNLGFASIW